MVDQNLASAPTVRITLDRPRYESRGYVPGKGHPDIRKRWQYLGTGPVTRPNPLLKRVDPKGSKAV